MVLRINFVCSSLGLSGGIGTVLRLANGLVDRGYDVTVTTLGSDKAEWFGEVKARVINWRMNLLQRGARKFLLRGLEFDWCRKLVDIMPDCDVNVATWYETVYPTLLSGKGEPYYLIQNCEPLFFEKDTVEWKKALHSYMYNLKKLAVSKWLSEFFDAVNIGNGVDLNTFRSFSFTYKYEPPYRIMAFLRGIEWKGENIVKDAVDLVKTTLGAKLVYPETVVSTDRIAVLYNVSHVFVFPSRFEGVGLPPLEAMACGCPVVVSDTVGIDEYAKHGENCLVVDKPDPVEYAYAIDTVLTDTELRERIIQGGFETVKEYDFNNVVDRFEREITK